MVRIIALVSLLAAASCEEEAPPPRPDAAPETDFLVRVWVEPEAGLPVEALIEGCREWLPVSVGCEATEVRAYSHVQVFANTDPCKKNPDGSYTLAYASCCGPVVFIRECLKNPLGQFDLKMVRMVMAHETGHQFGLWWHVPLDCGAENVPEHPDEGPICGKALMNAYLNGDLDDIQHPDVLAFDIRDRTYSVLEEAGTMSAAFTCVYTTRVP